MDGVTDRHRVATLLRTDDGAGVVVVRGVATETGSTPPTGRQEEVGLLLPSEDAGAAGLREMSRCGWLSWRRAGPVRWSTASSPFRPVTRRARDSEPAVARLPEGRGRLRNGAYAMQWWLFAGFAVVMAVRIARDLHRPRRVRASTSSDLSRHRLTAMRGAWIRYRIMAYLVGTLLVVLVLVGLPLKYWFGNPDVVTWTAIPHGYLYMMLLITAIDLGRRARWSWQRLLLIALAGTIPFLSFVAERSATKDVRRKLAAAQPAPPPSRNRLRLPNLSWRSGGAERSAGRRDRERI